MLRYDPEARRYVGERVSVAAEDFARVQQELEAGAGLAPERARTLLLNELLWRFDRRAATA